MKHILRLARDSDNSDPGDVVIEVRGQELEFHLQSDDRIFNINLKELQQILSLYKEI